MKNEPIGLDPTFTGTDGRICSLRFDVDACRRAKAEYGVKLTEIWMGTLAFRIMSEPDLAVDLAFLACETTDDPVAFAKLIGVERLPDVQDAVIDALAVFCNALTRNSVPAKIARAQTESFANMIEISEARARPKSIAEIEDLVDRMGFPRSESSGGGSMSTPESSGSTPDPEPLENSS